MSLVESLNWLLLLQSSPRDSGGQTTEVAIPSSSGSSPRNWNEKNNQLELASGEKRQTAT